MAVATAMQSCKLARLSENSLEWTAVHGNMNQKRNRPEQPERKRERSESQSEKRKRAKKKNEKKPKRAQIINAD